MLVSDVQTRVKEIFGDPDAIQLTDEMILRWINDARRDMEKKVEYQEFLGVGSPLNAATYSFAVVDGLVFYKEKSVFWLPTGAQFGNKLRPVSGQEIPLQASGSGSPKVYAREEQGSATFDWSQGPSILISPPPVADSGTLYVRYVGISNTDLTTGGNLSPTVPLQLQDLIITYCLYRAKQFDEDWVPAREFKQEYDLELKEAAASWNENAGQYNAIQDDIDSVGNIYPVIL